MALTFLSTLRAVPVAPPCAPAMSGSVLPSLGPSMATGLATCLGVAAWAARGARGARGGRQRRVVRLAEADPSSYVPILLEMEEGKAYQIEARPKDSVKTLKAVLNLELGLAEQAIELSSDGKVLTDEMELTEVDLKEGSKLQMKVLEVEEDALSSGTGDDSTIRIFVKVDSSGKTTKLTLNLDPEEGMEDVKLEAYEQFRDKVPFLCDSPVTEYGLFLLDGTPVEDSRGNLRWLKKDEYLKEDKTVAENGLEGGEEIVFANLMWLDRYSS
eukprot:Skav234711  [mRNA]  locus=scaffold634:48706:49518:+ [translate_table: standard]